MAPSRTHLSIARQHQQEVESAIERAGFHATHVLDDQENTAVSYTTGFLLAGHPELVTLGLDATDSLYVFEHLIDEVRSGFTRRVGRHASNDIDGGAIRLLPVPAEHWTGGTCLLRGFASFYGRRQHPVDESSVLQVVWPDDVGRFPWHVDVDVDLLRDQPVLADGDPPRRLWPLREPVDNRSRCSLCSSEPRNRAERRRQARSER